METLQIINLAEIEENIKRFPKYYDTAMTVTLTRYEAVKLILACYEATPEETGDCSAVAMKIGQMLAESEIRLRESYR